MEPEVHVQGEIIWCFKSIFPLSPCEITRFENFLLHESEWPSTSKSSCILSQPMHRGGFCGLLSPEQSQLSKHLSGQASYCRNYLYQIYFPYSLRDAGTPK